MHCILPFGRETTKKSSKRNCYNENEMEKEKSRKECYSKNKIKVLLNIYSLPK